MLLGVLRAPFHVRPDGGGRRVEDRHAVPFNDLPPSARIGPVRCPFVHDAGGVVGERTVDDVRVPSHPADVGGAPVDVLLLDVEDVAVGAR